jgi:sterol carrier protein 2
MARSFIVGGLADCILALGFEKMEKGSLGAKWGDRENPISKFMLTLAKSNEITSAPFAPQMFGQAGREHMELYGTTRE